MTELRTSPATPIGDDLLTRLEGLLDREAIRDLLIAFARALDEKDWDAYAALFTPSGTLHTPRDRHEGREGLAAFVERDLGGYRATHHVAASHSIDLLDATHARVRASLHATHVVGEAPSQFWATGGWYDYELLKDQSRWQIASVTIHPVWRLDT